MRSLFSRKATEVDGTELDVVVTAVNARKRMTKAQRVEFDAEWRAALASATRTFDPTPLHLCARDWWVRTGGDPATARRAAQRRERLTHVTEATIGDFRARVRRHGPTVFAALEPWQQVEMEEEWHRRCIEVAESYDLQPLEGLITLYWGKLGVPRSAPPPDHPGGGRHGQEIPGRVDEVGREAA